MKIRGNQFIHLYSVSETGRNIYRTIDGVKKLVGFNNTKSVIGEAFRQEGYISHLKHEILNPVILYDIRKDDDYNLNKEYTYLNEAEFIQKKIDDWKSGTDTRGHKIRKDANCLLSAVISWPPKLDDETNEEYMEAMKIFENDLIKWLKQKYKDDFLILLRHDDEPFKGVNEGKVHHHWHFLCSKGKIGERYDLHPGFVARAEYNISRKDRANMSKKEINIIIQEGKEAYKKAMIDYQNEAYINLFSHHNLGRIGEGRKRRSRYEQVKLEEYTEKEIKCTKEICNNIITKTKNEGKIIIEKAKTEGEIKKDDIINAAWNTAKIIEINAKKEANEIFQKREDKIRSKEEYITDIEYVLNNREKDIKDWDNERIKQLKKLEKEHSKDELDKLYENNNYTTEQKIFIVENYNRKKLLEIKNNLDERENNIKKLENEIKKNPLLSILKEFVNLVLGSTPKTIMGIIENIKYNLSTKKPGIWNYINNDNVAPKLNLPKRG